MSNDTQRSISTSVWSDPWFEKQNPDVKLLWLYLLTHPKSNMLGIFEITPERTSFETGIPLERVTQGFRTLDQGVKAMFCQGYVWVVNFVRHQKFNDNMKISARRNFEEIPENVRNEFAVKGSEPITNPWGTLCNGLGIPFVKLEIGNMKYESNTLSLSRTHTHTREADVNPILRMDAAPIPFPEAEEKRAPQMPGTYAIPSLKNVIEYANTLGFNEDVATRYYDMRQADGWLKQGRNGEPRPIADWYADFRLKARDLKAETTQPARMQAPSFERPGTYNGPDMAQIAAQADRLFATIEEKAS